MNKKFGIIGAGNIGSSILQGVSEKAVFSKENIFVAERSPEKVKELQKDYHVNVVEVDKLIEDSDIILIAIKPKDVDDFFKMHKSKFSKDKIFISIVAGLDIAKMTSCLGKSVYIARVMPNLGAKVLSSVSAVAFSDNFDDEHRNIVIEILEAIGSVYNIEERLFEAVTGMSGSSPAFIFQIIEAMSDAGVSYGLDRELAIRLSADAVLSSSRLVLETKMHPAKLKDMVCSPNGTTIEGVKEIEKHGVRYGIISAVSASINRAIEFKNNINRV